MQVTDTGLNRLAARIANQTELDFTLPEAGSLVGRIRTQFAHRGLVSVSDVAVACNVNCRTVLAWGEAGLIERINIGTGDKAYYRIYAPSVVRFFEKRSQQP